MKKLVVIGGGYIGIELGGVFVNFGIELIIFEGGLEILLIYEKDMVFLVKCNLKSKNVEMVIKVFVKFVEEIENGVKVMYEVNGEIKIIEVDYVLVIVGCCLNIDEIGLE